MRVEKKSLPSDNSNTNKVKVGKSEGEERTKLKTVNIYIKVNKKRKKGTLNLYHIACNKGKTGLIAKHESQKKLLVLRPLISAFELNLFRYIYVPTPGRAAQTPKLVKVNEHGCELRNNKLLT